MNGVVLSPCPTYIHLAVSINVDADVAADVAVDTVVTVVAVAVEESSPSTLSSLSLPFLVVIFQAEKRSSCLGVRLRVLIPPSSGKAYHHHDAPFQAIHVHLSSPTDQSLSSLSISRSHNPSPHAPFPPDPTTQTSHTSPVILQQRATCGTVLVHPTLELLKDHKTAVDSQASVFISTPPPRRRYSHQNRPAYISVDSSWNAFRPLTLVADASRPAPIP